MVLSPPTKSYPTLTSPWTVAHQAPLSMWFLRREQWGGLPPDLTWVSFIAGGFFTNLSHQFSSVQFSRSVVSNSLQPHESQHATRDAPNFHSRISGNRSRHLHVFRALHVRPGLSWCLSGKESACSAGDPGSILVWKDPRRRKWQPLLLFLPGKSQGQRSLVGCSPWGCKRVGHDLATNVWPRLKATTLYPWSSKVTLQV